MASIHASCVMLRGRGVLIRGPSGIGKSLLAWRLVEAERDAGREALLVADDRVLLHCEKNQLIAAPAPGLAGLIELRGLGIVEVPHAPAAPLFLVADLTAGPWPRLPEQHQGLARIEGVELPRIEADPAVAFTLIRARLDPSFKRHDDGAGQ